MAYTIHIFLSKRRLVLLLGGQAISSYPVGVGKTATPTPVGTYYIANKRPNPGGPFGVMWMGLSISGYGIHGTNRPGSIGGGVSKGCIRMYNKDVLELSQMVPIGTPVIISS